MKNKAIILVLASFGGFVHANLQEKLAVKSELINVAKQNVKAGKPIIANERCIKCGNKDCKQSC